MHQLWNDEVFEQAAYEAQLRRKVLGFEPRESEEMIWLLKMIIFGHVHKWKSVKEERYKLHDGNVNHIVAHGTQYILQCEHCGSMKKFRP